MNKLFALVSFQVNALVFAAIERARFPDGALREDHAVEAVPEHAPHTGAAPFAEVRQRVPAPPVAVAPRDPELFLT